MVYFLKSISKFLKLDPSFESPNQLPKYPSVTKCSLHGRGSETLVCDITSLLRSQSFFPFFMLVAYEGGSVLRAFLLLLSWPVLWVLSYDLKLRVMIFITFCCLRLKDMQKVSRAVLPKFYLEDLNPHVYEVFAATASRLVFTSLPTVMVDEFVEEYLSADAVKGTELSTTGEFFTGFVSNSGLLVKHAALEEFCGDQNYPDVGIGCSNLDGDLELISLCKEAYVVGIEDVEKPMPRGKYPKPLIFHDGRLAFLPTPIAMLNMFLWLPFGLLLAIFRLSVGALIPFLPCKVVIMLYTLSGMEMRLNVRNPTGKNTSKNGKGVLYVCNHRNNADPAFLILALNNKSRPLTSVVYGVSKIFQMITPLKLISLSRNDRTKDAAKIQKLLSEGDLVMFPEGTTCREPYILRFSSLFAELTDDIVPVAVNLEVGMFYGASASGFFKVLDGLFLAMNPRIYYSVDVLEKLPRELTVGGGKSIHEVANTIQKKLAHELGFECSTLRRKDKYMILAGTEGVIQQ